MRVAVYYGSTTGHTGRVARLVASAFASDEVVLRDISGVTAADFDGFDLVIFGASTWGEGVLEANWETFFPVLDAIDLEGQYCAVFGLGDQFSYPETFVDAMGIIGERLREKGAILLGRWPNAGYTFDRSKALEGDHFIGLVIDEDNEPELSEARVATWAAQLRLERLSA